MVNSRRHPLIDGLLMAAMVVSSFGVFVYVLAQTTTVTAECLNAGITDPVSCDAFMATRSASGTTNNTTAATTTGTTDTSAATGSTAVSCTDSDGRDYSVRGYASTATSVEYDACADQFTVAEKYCSSEGVRTELKKCDSGLYCNEGRCVPTTAAAPVPTTTTTTTTTAVTDTVIAACADTDGGDAPAAFGIVNYAGQDFPDRCVSSLIVEEQICSSSGRSAEQHQCYNGYECRDGRCVPVTRTSVTTTTTASAVCGNSICETAFGETSAVCAADCPVTAANTVTASVCTDTDGGKVYDARGVVSENGIGYPDYCNADGSLLEMYCDGGSRRYESRACGTGMRCSEGRCVTVMAPVTTSTTNVVNSSAVCGNGTCETALGETTASCARDCQAATTSTVQTTAVAPTCTDTDGGKAYATRGVVTVGGVGYPDFCKDESSLQEEFCDAGQRRYDVRSCGTGMRCSEGKCVTAPAATAETVTTAVGTTVAEPTRETANEETGADSSVASDAQETVKAATDIQNYLPKACIEKGFTDAVRCAEFIRASTSTDSATVTLPTECVKAGVTTRSECEKHLASLSVSEQCRSAGALTSEACRAYVVAQTKVAGLDDACRSAGVLTVAACESYLFEKQTARPVQQESDTVAVKDAAVPTRCIAAGISEKEACAKYLAYADLPMDCLRQGIESKSDCETYLKGKFVDPVCASQGITDAAACREFIYGRIASSVSCSGLASGECALAVKERHLGTILEVNSKIADIENGLDDVTDENGHVDFDKLNGEADASKLSRVLQVLPVKPEGRQLLALKSRQQVSLYEDDTIGAGAGRIIAYDTDGDGVTDDAEKRIGLDPAAADSKDAVAARRTQLAPIDRAIIDGKEIGQPLSEGAVDTGLTVVLPDQAKNDATSEAKGPSFQGTGKPGEVVTLYVYSELPVVVTAKVGEDGTWSYEFDDALSEGTHEVYVAVNDDTGRVTRKGNPLSFLVQGASAATTAQAASEAALSDISPFVAAQEAPSYDIRMFLAGGAALLLVAFGLMAALFRKPEQVQ